MSSLFSLATFSAQSGQSDKPKPWTCTLSPEVRTPKGNLWGRLSGRSLRNQKDFEELERFFEEFERFFAELERFFEEFERFFEDLEDSLRNQEDSLRNQKDFFRNQKDVLRNQKDSLTNQKDALRNSKDSAKQQLLSPAREQFRSSSGLQMLGPPGSPNEKRPARALAYMYLWN